MRNMQQKHYIVTTAVICAIILVILLIGLSNVRMASLGRRVSPEHSSASVLNTYQAPMRHCDNPTRVSNEYEVFLRHGHTMERHKMAIGNTTDLESAITHIVPPRDTHGLFYSAKFDDAGLAAVRADSGVNMVECELEGIFIGDVAPPVPYNDNNAEVDELEALLFH